MFFNKFKSLHPEKRDALAKDLLDLVNDAKIHVFKTSGSMNAKEAEKYAVAVSSDFTEKLVLYIVKREQKIALEFYKRGRENCEGVH